MTNISAKSQRYPPYFTLDREEVAGRASAGCPADLIELIIDCTAAEPANRPAMPIVLERLRKMEIDILSQLTMGQGEHVGSIKIVKPRGKIAQASASKAFSNLFAAQREPSVEEESEEYHNTKERPDEFEYDTEEEEVAQMMKGSLKIEHAGREQTTWRTARWDEPKAEKETVMDLFNNPPGKL
jgi:LIM domain kinase 1